MYRIVPMLTVLALSFAVQGDVTVRAGSPCCGHGCGAHGCGHHHGGWHLFKHSCSKHCCCCCDQQESRQSRDADEGFARSVPVAPSGPIVESYPMMRAMPAMMAMPMMMGYPTRSVGFEQPRDECETRYKKRIDELDERVEALDIRMNTILRAVELQTQILEEIKVRGTIGKQPIPQAAAGGGQS